MGTVVVGAVLKTKRTENHCSAVVTAHIAEDIAAIKGTIWRC